MGASGLGGDKLGGGGLQWLDRLRREEFEQGRRNAMEEGMSWTKECHGQRNVMDKGMSWKLNLRSTFRHSILPKDLN